MTYIFSGWKADHCNSSRGKGGVKKIKQELNLPGVRVGLPKSLMNPEMDFPLPLSLGF